jgi:hypothetical protein
MVDHLHHDCTKELPSLWISVSSKRCTAVYLTNLASNVSAADISLPGIESLI